MNFDLFIEIFKIRKYILEIIGYMVGNRICLKLKLLCVYNNECKKKI